MVQRKAIYAIVIVLVLIVAGVLIFSVPAKSSGNLAVYDNVLVPSALVAQLNVPNNISNQVGIGTASYQVLTKLNGKSLLETSGKPQILYIGAEYCPFCAAERWAMVIALSRFGTFSNLHFMTSSASDYAPSTPTFTFYNSTYTSGYISFVPVEQTTNVPDPASASGYVPLQQANSSQIALITGDDRGGSIPFILFANMSAISGSSYDPLGVLGQSNWSDIAGQLWNPSSLQATSIIGTANLLTEEICSADNNTPASVCSQPYVIQIRKLVG